MRYMRCGRLALFVSKHGLNIFGMDISGLSIGGSAVRQPRQQRRREPQQEQQRQRGGRPAAAGGKTAEGKRNAGAGAPDGGSALTHMSGAAERQRMADGHGAGNFVLSGDGQHDKNRFSFRHDADWENVDPEAFGVSRGKYWNQELENNFRIQQCGWRDVYEYRKIHGEPEIWRSSGLISKVYTKKTGFITYWQQERECPDSKLHLVKLFKYRTKAVGSKSAKK